MNIVVVQVILLYPEEGRVEIDPDDLWREFVSVVKGAVQGESLSSTGC